MQTLQTVNCLIYDRKKIIQLVEKECQLNVENKREAKYCDLRTGSARDRGKIMDCRTMIAMILVLIIFIFSCHWINSD